LTHKDIILTRLTKLHPKIIDLSLDRMLYLLEKLGNPHLKIPPTIHIAGTNGKGSTLSFVKAGLEAGGKSVNAYTSPHLVNFNERITLQSKEIQEPLLSYYLELCEKLNKKNNITFFEITTCAAFLAFSQHEADYTLLEVGLGGRLDATNVINSPILTVITPVSIDHQKFLGDSILNIAFEKAGILKPKVPAIIGKQPKKVKDKICSIAADVGTTVSIFGRDWSSRKFNDHMIYEDNDGIIELPAPILQGDHQYENAGIAVNILKTLNYDIKIFEKALLYANWPARLQKLKSGPLLNKLKSQPFETDLWIDGGHNEAAGRVIASFLESPFNGTSHLILGMINSKDVKTFLSEMASKLDSIACITIPGEVASLTGNTIVKEAALVHKKSFISDSVEKAIDSIIMQNSTNSNLRILISGSLYLCGHILSDHA
jgi:dihydrofolate synthase/folylpolyglutamate synthase